MRLKINNVRVVRKGNSSHIILPAWYCKAYDVNVGDSMHLEIKNNALIVKKEKKKKTSKQLEV